VSGDFDLSPCLNKIKKLGKSVVIATFNDSFSKKYNKDYPLISLEILIAQCKLTFTKNIRHMK